MERSPKSYVMKGIKREPWRCSRVATIAGYLLLAIGLSVLAGCAINGKAKLEPVVDTPAVAAEPTPLPTGPTVVRFTDGREGFLITEPSSMDAASRADFEQANALIQAAEYEKASELLEKVIAQSPGTTAPYINIAMAYKQTNKTAQAEQHLKTALELFPGHPVASNEYGLLLRKAGRFTEGRAIYEKSLATFPEYYPINKNLGILCDLYLHDLACALEHYEIYSKDMPKDEQVKIWIADLHTRLGH
jgi:tetratricopeptide (TPR) repeat protein